jgi:glycosyltransferase involved in cell wall biosynthesis
MNRPVRVLALAATPVFYQVPLYRRLAQDPRVDLELVYASNGGARAYDAGFGRPITWDVELLSGYKHGLLRHADTNDVRAGFFALRDWDVVGRVLRGDVDVLWVHSYSYVTTWLAMGAARLRRIPILLREEQTLLRERPRPKRWVRAVVLRALFRHVHALSIGSANRAYFQRFGVPDHRIFFVPYAAENDELQREAEELAPKKTELRRSFGIDDEAGPVVLVVAKLVPGKGVETALAAFREVRERRRCSLLVVGDGELRDIFDAEVARDGLSDVKFAGFLNRSEITRAFAAADIFLVPSHSDTWGIVVNEAMNFGLPVIATVGVGSAYDLITPHENGFVVPVGDVRATAEAIEFFVADGDSRRRWGGRSREMIGDWSFDRAAEGIIAAAMSATGQSPSSLRVAMLPLQPRSSAATRAYCVRPVARLRELGVDVSVMPPPAAWLHDRLKDSGWVRIPTTIVYWYAIALPMRLVQIARALSHDVIFVQRGLLRVRSAPVLEAILFGLARVRRRAVVYHADDALHVLAPRRAALRYRCATIVMTGSDEVASAARAVGARVARVETGIDVDLYPVRRHTDRTPIVIGWIGTNAGDHLAPVAHAVRALVNTDDVVLRVCSARPYVAPELAGHLEWRQWAPEIEHSVFADLDIGVMPLADTAYNRGKEAYKLKEYMAAGLPVVCSPVGCNTGVVEEGMTGFFARDAGQWEQRLRELVRSVELRQRLGDAGRRRAVEQFDVRRQAETFANLLELVTQRGVGTDRESVIS